MVRRHVISAALPIAALLAMAPAAPAAEPRIEVGEKKLRSSLVCQRAVTDAKRTPVLLVTGTGVDGDEAWPSGLQVSLRRERIASCYVNFPQHTTADVQVSVQYLVNAIRVMRRRAGRDIAIYGISQGALLPRFALTYWPSLRPMVSDAVLLAGTGRGSTVFGSLVGACGSDCRFPAAAWQQAAGSNLLDALNRRGRDETPGRTSWTTVRSLNDELVQPVDGPRPASALGGASNLVIQRICPGRETNHISVGSDSVSYAALRDAMTHRGPARASRIDRDACDSPVAPGLDPEVVRAAVQELYRRATPRTLQGADGGVLLPREPAVRAYVRRR